MFFFQGGGQESKPKVTKSEGKGGLPKNLPIVQNSDQHRKGKGEDGFYQKNDLKSFQAGFSQKFTKS